MPKEFTISGFEDIDRRLRELEPKVAKKCLRKAMRPAMKEVQKAAKDNAPVASGKLKRNIKVRAGKRSRSNVYLNVQVGDDAFDNFYPKFVEYGTKNQPAQAYMRRAYDQVGERAKELCLEKLLELIEAEARK